MFLNHHRFRASLAGAVMVLAGAGGVHAQEIGASHLDAAMRAYLVAPSVGDFNALLPFLSEQVQNRLIRVRPDLFREISAVVEAEALELSGRKADLDNDVARVWARAFTEQELNLISDFFGSELGDKYKEVMPKVGEGVLRASRGWTNRLSDELLERSTEELKRQGHAF